MKATVVFVNMILYHVSLFLSVEQVYDIYYKFSCSIYDVWHVSKYGSVEVDKLMNSERYSHIWHYQAYQEVLVLIFMS